MKKYKPKRPRPEKHGLVYYDWDEAKWFITFEYSEERGDIVEVFDRLEEHFIEHLGIQEYGYVELFKDSLEKSTDEAMKEVFAFLVEEFGTGKDRECTFFIQIKPQS